MNNFDLFRLNCFLNDIQAHDFKRVLLSLTCEFIFDHNNKDVKLTDCHSHIINYHKIEIDKEYFTSIVTDYKHIDITPIQSDLLLRLTTKKFNDIHDQINDHSIEVYIRSFIKSRNRNQDLLEPIKSILYQTVYQNIHTFSSENLINLLSKNVSTNYSQEQINAYNEFLEDDDLNKNTAVYNIFLKATEFAIITSGKGVKEFTKDIFKGKTYYYDTNILFRLLGIGGVERQNSLIALIKYCSHQGILFEYTPETYFELKRKLQTIVKYLKNTETNYDIIALADLAASDPQLFNDDFVLHYSKLRASSQITNPDQYEIYLLTEFRKLETQLNFSLTKTNVKIEDKDWDKITLELFGERKKLPHGSRYTKTAAKTDAFNILFVKKVRGVNNYNYTNVKSFYLTTDRTLNQLLSNNRPIIPETILPSQLFILHNPYISNGEEIDYDLFLKFVKRRSSEFKFKGGEVLKFIDSIRRKTSSKEEMHIILKTYSDKRYEVSDNYNVDERKIRPLEEIIDTVLDKKLKQGELDSQELNKIKFNANKQIPVIISRTKLIIRIFDVSITIVIIPLSVLLIKNITQNIYLILLLTVTIEIVKFWISSKTKVLSKFWKFLLIYKVKSSSYYKLTKDTHYLTQFLLEFNEVDGEIWKKKKELK